MTTVCVYAQPYLVRPWHIWSLHVCVYVPVYIRMPTHKSGIWIFGESASVFFWITSDMKNCVSMPNSQFGFENVISLPFFLLSPYTEFVRIRGIFPPGTGLANKGILPLMKSSFAWCIPQSGFSWIRERLVLWLNSTSGRPEEGLWLESK